MAELELARRAAERGGRLVRDYFESGVEIRSKSPGDLVSDADLEAERAIVRAIRDAYPDHAVIAEEAHRGEPGGEHVWIVDPLDGTNNFAHGIPHFAVSVAYYRAGIAECGVVHHPIRDDWYVATRGGGATYNGRPVTVGRQERLDQVLIGVGFYYDRGAMMRATLAAIERLFGEQIHGIRRFGTASLDLCCVGCGQFGGFFEYDLSPWDFAAGRLFVEEAGGTVTTCRGDSLPLARTSVLASNGRLHAQLVKLLGPGDDSGGRPRPAAPEPGGGG